MSGTDEVKTIFRVEFNDEGDFKFVRPHRQYYGRDKKVVKCELELGEDEPIFATLAADEEGCPGRSIRVEGVPGLVITAEPALFGTDDERRAMGRLPLKKLEFGEWNLVTEIPG